MFKLKLGYLLVFLCFNYLLSSQILEFEEYTTKDGLLSDEVYNLHQDTKGYLWLFTNYGAMKYNGKEFSSVLKNLPFQESFIYCIYENEKGQKWVANSNAKIYEIVNDSAFLVKGTESISKELKESACPIFQIYADDSLNIYVTTKHYSYKFCKSTNYKAINLSYTVPHDSLLTHAIELEKSILTVTNHIRYGDSWWADKADSISFIHTLQYKTQGIYKIKCGYLDAPRYFKRFGDNIYGSTYHKIFRIYKNKFINEIPINSFILSFTKDENNHLWIGTYNNGLYELDENDSIINHYLKNKTVNCVIADSQNGLWVSTEGSGLLHCKNLNELHFDEVLGNQISFIKTINDKFFISTINGEVLMLENNRLTEIISKGQISEVPHDIVPFNDKYLITFSNSIRVYDPNKKTISKPIFHPRRIIYGYKLLTLNKDSFVCIERKGITFFSGEKFLKLINTNCKTYWCEKRNQILYVATEKGVYQLINDRFYQPDYLLPTKNSIVTKIRKDDLGNYWFCSKGSGLFKLTNNDKLIKYSTLNELPSNIINDISFVPGKGILLSTNNGLFYCPGKSSGNDLKKWNKIYAEEVKGTVLFNEKLYLNTKNGLVIINKKNLEQEESLHFNLASVLVNGNPIPEKSLFQLDYKENNLEFNFDVILFSSNAPDIKYSLQGTKSYFGSTKNQQITFQNLLPGNYTLFAYPDLKNSNKKILEIPFTIVPAFWQTVWFKVLFFLIVVFAIVFVVWLYFRYRKIKEDKKNSINKLITEYKLVALKAQINPHFMSNCLTAIQHLIISNKVDAANQYLAKFSLLVRQVLNFSTKPFVSLQEEIEITKLNIELEQLRFENKFVFELELEDKHHLRSIFIPPLILQPIIENAIWHGLLPLKKLRKGKLLLIINMKDDLLYIIIEDNGVGRKSNNNSISNLRESKGISITKQRIENLNSFYQTTKADLKYEDLVDAYQNPLGTRVSIILPINLIPDENENN